MCLKARINKHLEVPWYGSDWGLPVIEVVVGKVVTSVLEYTRDGDAMKVVVRRLCLGEGDDTVTVTVIDYADCNGDVTTTTSTETTRYYPDGSTTTLTVTKTGDYKTVDKTVTTVVKTVTVEVC